MASFNIARVSLFACLPTFVAACASSMPASQTSASSSEASQAKQSARGRYLFVASNNRRGGHGFISVYELGQKTPVLEIDSGVDQPNGLVVDGAGNLYVADNQTNRKQGAILEYAAGSSRIVRKITDGVYTPDWITLDSAGDLYVANFLANTVTVYGSSGSSPIRTISDGVSNPEIVKFDAMGNVFVLNYTTNGSGPGSVTEYASGSTQRLGTIADGVMSPGGLAFDPSFAKIYVSNLGNNSITVYDAATLHLRQKITRDLEYPNALAFDSAGELYVQNAQAAPNGSVAIFSPGSSSPIKTITKGVDAPSTIAFDDAGNFYVGNLKSGKFSKGRFNRGSVAAYAPGKIVPSYEIRDGVDGVVDLAFGPQP